MVNPEGSSEGQSGCAGRRGRSDSPARWRSPGERTPSSRRRSWGSRRGASGSARSRPARPAREPAEGRPTGSARCSGSEDAWGSGRPRAEHDGAQGWSGPGGVRGLGALRPGRVEARESSGQGGGSRCCVSASAGGVRHVGAARGARRWRAPRESAARNRGRMHGGVHGRVRGGAPSDDRRETHRELRRWPRVAQRGCDAAQPRTVRRRGGGGLGSALATRG